VVERLRSAPPDPESFFAAQRRHRRAAGRIAVLAAVAAIGQSLLVATMTAPLTFAVLTVGLDLANLAVPTPDLVQAWDRHPARLLGLLVGAGAVTLLVIWVRLRAGLRVGLAGAALVGGARPPDESRLDEHRLVDVVAEAALAAGIAAPRIVLVPDGMNVAAFGTGPDDATLIVPAGLIARLERRRTAAVVAHQVASVANGDLVVQHAVQALPVAWAVPARLMAHPFSRATWRLAGALLLLLLGRLDPAREAALLDDLLTRDERELDQQADGGGLVPVMIYAAWSGMRVLGDLLVVGPLVTVWVRRRRYLADATAVQLTRDPDGLAAALVRLVAERGAMPGTGSVDLACVVRPRPEDAKDGPMGGLEAWHPPTARRLRRLEALGYRPSDHERAEARAVLERVEPSARARDVRPPTLLRRAVGAVVMVVVVVPLLAVAAVLVAAAAVVMLWLSLMPVVLFYLVPVLAVVLPLHHLLRG
jgi:Zn-dependent protease with chaperone function